MNRVHLLNSLRIALGLASLATAVYCATLVHAFGADTETPDSKSKDSIAKDASSASKAKKKLTGAELYAIHCSRCHTERYATEFTAAQWKTIILHMRVRANLPATQAKEILKFLQADNGN